jgi:hypothetical protein
MCELPLTSSCTSEVSVAQEAGTEPVRLLPARDLCMCTVIQEARVQEMHTLLRRP